MCIYVYIHIHIYIYVYIYIYIASYIYATPPGSGLGPVRGHEEGLLRLAEPVLVASHYYSLNNAM